jgi:hypothetical protein
MDSDRRHRDVSNEQPSRQARGMEDSQPEGLEERMLHEALAISKMEDEERQKDVDKRLEALSKELKDKTAREHLAKTEHDMFSLQDLETDAKYEAKMQEDLQKVIKQTAQDNQGAMVQGGRRATSSNRSIQAERDRKGCQAKGGGGAGENGSRIWF